jgi:predicted ATP-grasp superfamily ATP-dependent carboligase
MARRVIVTDVHDRAGLGACRSLRSSGFLVTGVASAHPAPGHWSRSCSERFALVDPRLDPAAYVEGLESIVSRDDYDVLLPGSDASLLAVSERRAALERRVKLGLPSDDVVRRTLDKRTLLSAAAEAGLACPDTAVCSSPQAAVGAARDFGFPIIVKPRSTVFADRGELIQLGSLLADDLDNLERIVRRVGRPFLVQRAEEGDQYSVAGVIAEGQLIASAVSRYVRTWPVRTGMAAFSETVIPPSGLVGRVERLVRGLGWQGIFELELIRRPDGTFAAIDFNPRLYGSIILADSAGAAIPAVWCEWLLGLNPVAVSARAGLRYRWEDADLRHGLWQIRRGNVGRALRVFRPYRCVVHAHVGLTDPAPLLARLILLLRNRHGDPQRPFAKLSRRSKTRPAQEAETLVKDT